MLFKKGSILIDLFFCPIFFLITQKTVLQAEIKLLETQLQHAAMFKDAFSQIKLYKDLEEKKSMLDTLEWM